MNRKDEQINIEPLSVAQMSAHKRRLKVALLTYHERQSSVHGFGVFIIDLLKCMSLAKKSTALATLALFAALVTAGIAGPSASEVAQAEAVSTVKRAFARFVNLSEEEKAELEQRFQDRIHFKEEGAGPFKGIDEISAEDREAHHQEMKASLSDSLAQAQSAEDLEVISAQEMPVPGFFGKAGRAFGFKMMRPFSENLENLPEDIKVKIQEREEMRVEMQPVKFLKYTNSEGQKVTLGVNAIDEPVMKFVEGECLSFGCSAGPHQGMPRMQMWKIDETFKQGAD